MVGMGRHQRQFLRCSQSRCYSTSCDFEPVASVFVLYNDRQCWSQMLKSSRVNRRVTSVVAVHLTPTERRVEYADKPQVCICGPHQMSIILI